MAFYFIIYSVCGPNNEREMATPPYEHRCCHSLIVPLLIVIIDLVMSQIHTTIKYAKVLMSVCKVSNPK